MENKVRYFIFTWCRMNEFFQRHNKVIVSKPTGDIGRDAHTATQVFISTFGNLKKTNIISIQEVDENEKPIGLPITPSAENSIIPTRRK